MVKLKQRTPRATQSSVRIAKFHAALIGDTAVYAKTKRQEAVRCFFRQGDLSTGGCAIYAASTILSALSVVRANAMAVAANRKHGVARDVFRALQHSYFDCGITGPEVYDALVTLDLPVKLTLRDAEDPSDTSGRRKVEKLALTALDEGSLVMIAFRCQRPYFLHWIVAVGTGFLQQGSRSICDTIYALDPGDETIPLAVYNTVLRRNAESRQERWLMQARDGSVRKVTLISAIRFDVP